MTAYVAETAAGLLRRVVEVSSTVRGALEEEIPELRGDAGTIDLLGASVEGNVDTLLHALRHDIPVQRVEAPTAALEYARRLAQRGVPVNALVRAYRLGQRRMTELVFHQVAALDIPAATRFAVIEAITATMFEYIDWISQQVVAVYEDERERWLENQNTLRAVRVREVLAGKTADVDAATNTIRYPLRWHHLAVVMWYPDVGAEGHELARLQRFLRDLGQAADAAAAPLFVAADRTCAWGWLPYRTAAPNALSRVRGFASKGPEAPSVAIGTMAAGVEGFRKSHRDAESAHAVAIVRAAPDQRVIAATDPGLSVAALLGGDIDVARRWVGEVLGDLTADNENDARLRETLRVFLRCGSSYKQAADELGMHFNTVKYRVGRAIARRGRSIATDRLDVELALLMCQWYGTAVLAPEAG